MDSIFGWGYGQVKSVCSVCVVLCLGSVHSYSSGGFGVCRAIYIYVSMYLEAAGCELWWLDMYLELY